MRLLHNNTVLAVAASAIVSAGLTWATVALFPYPVPGTRYVSADYGNIMAASTQETGGVILKAFARPYRGKHDGLWGAPTTPPWSVLWSLEIAVGDVVYEVPPPLVRDLANVLQVRTSAAMESDLRATCNVVLSQEGLLTVSLNGGDGAHAYWVRFEYDTCSHSGWRRQVEYYQP